MKKLENALKSVNKLGLLAIAVVAFATVAFTPAKRAMTLYGFDRSVGQWVDLSGVSEGTSEGNYQCDVDPENKNCTAEFDHAPSASEQPATGRKGIFYIVE